ncbi:MAG: asparagine synthase-related protein [Gemmatimonadota bacterium]|nr:asparagine synthase-related protein [Gemmatimonadota bacterium]
MSALAAIVRARAPVLESSIDGMLSRMRHRGAERQQAWRDGNAALGVARHAWECDPAIAGPAAVAHDGAISVVADASLYYLDDLRVRLRSAGVEVTDHSASALIAAAYRAWGTAAAERLEGDFGFVLWDAGQQRLLAACDYTGGRSLFFTTTRDGVALASTIGALRGLPGQTSSLNLVSIAETAAGLFAASDDTAFQGISRLGAAQQLEWRPGKDARVTRFWHAPRFASEEGPRLPFDDAAVELRSLLIDAVQERMPSSGPTAVTMSGGWDSTSVFGAGQEAMRRGGAAGRALLPVSVSFPEGDTGREDETIQAIAARWSVPVQWVDIRSAPMFDQVIERARVRDEPFAHPYESFNRALSRRSAESGARVMLNGFAGDPLFQVSPIFLADLMRRGRWPSMIREWRAFGGAGWRNLFRWSVLPLLPQFALSAATMLRGGEPLRGHLEKTLPPWMNADFVRRHQLVERNRLFTPMRRGEGEASYESRWSLEHAFFPRIYGTVVDLGLDEGVAARAPLFDERVLNFAASRPRVERASLGETKRLLRAAMRGVLPDDAIAKRTERTGTLVTYFVQSIRDAYAPLIARLCDRSHLERLGIVDGEVLRREATRVAGDMSGPGPGWLIFTFLAEVWLREHSELLGESSQGPSV